MQSSLLPSHLPEPKPLCQFEAAVAGGIRCSECGRSLPAWTGKPPFAVCSGKPVPPVPVEPPATATTGPGTELKKLLRLVGITATPTCPCNARAAQMDIWGADECQQRLDEIVGWLREEAGRRHLPFSATAARQVVLLAIRRARKTAAH
jgi:hypothetical protein